MYGFIYVTTNLVNGKRYIGQHQRSRLKYGDRYYLGSGVAITNAVKKYGRGNFYRHILQWCPDQESLDAAEMAWIAQEGASTSREWYNITAGGGGGRGRIQGAEERAKKSAALKGRRKPDGFGENVSKRQTGSKLSEERVARMRGVPRPKHVIDALIAKNSKPIQCIETGIIYESGVMAAAALGCSASMINNVIHGRGRAKTAKGYTFRFVDKQNIS